MDSAKSQGRLSDRRALVTGGNRGIGFAIADCLVKEGAAVTVLVRSAAAADKTTQALRCAAVVADVTDEQSLRAALSGLGGIDILVNNAGIAVSKPFLAHSTSDWQGVFAVNLTGTFLCTRLLLPGMVERGWGRIVNIASTAGLKPYRYTTAYCAAKHGVIGFTRALALEMAGKGVTVNAVCPGFTDTDLASQAAALISAETGRTVAEAKAALARLNPQNRLTAPEEIATAVAFLCQLDAHGITGQSLIVAGGEVM